MLQVYRSLRPPVSLGELVFGLQLLARQHAARGPAAADVLTGTPVTDVALLHSLVDDVDLARGCYMPDARSAAAHSHMKVQDIVVFVGESSYLRPGYWVGLDHRARQVVWAVRGTKHVKDLLIDLSSEHPYMAGHTHWGMRTAAEWMLRREGHRVADLLRRHTGYGLHLVGHSLGGGVVSLVAHMLHNDPSMAALVLPPGVTASGPVGSTWHTVTATAVAPPCVMGREMAESCRPYVRSIILGCDLVPRLNADTLATLRGELAQIDWAAAVQDRIAEHALVQGVVSAVGTATGRTSLQPRDALRGMVDAVEALRTRQLSQVEGFNWILSQLSQLSQLQQQSPIKSAGGMVSDAYDKLVRLLSGAPQPRPALTDGSEARSSASSSSGGGNRSRAAGAAAAQAGAPIGTPPDSASTSTAATAMATRGQGQVPGSEGAPAPAVVRSHEPDLTPSANLLSDVAQRVEGMLRAAPPEVRDACLQLFSVVRTADLELPAAVQWPPPDWRRLLGSLRKGDGSRSSQAGTEGAPTPDPAAPSHVLHPAGRLFYIQKEEGLDKPTPSAQDVAPSATSSIGGGSSTTATAGHTVVEVPPGAPYFQHALLISQAMRDHKSRAYRAGLVDAIARASGGAGA